MQLRKINKTLFLITTILLLMLPTVFTSSINLDDAGCKVQALHDDKERSVILYKREDFHNYFEIHYYRLKVKEGASYHLRLKLLTELDANFQLRVQVLKEYGDPVVTGFDVISEEIANWGSSTSSEQQVIDLRFQADEDYVFRLVIVKNSGTVNGGDYSLYFNQAGFAGYWWIILAGVGIVVLVVFVITFPILHRKKSKGKKRRRK